MSFPPICDIGWYEKSKRKEKPRVSVLLTNLKNLLYLRKKYF